MPAPQAARRRRKSSPAAFVLVLALALPLLDPGAGLGEDGAFTPKFHPALTVHRAAGPIHVDGDLDDPGWRGAARATGFAEVSPGDQVKPPVASQAWVTYDDDHLYVALLAFDDPDEVRSSICDRDRIFHDDYFGIMIDTYGEQRWGYELFVNPLGIQGDLRLIEGGDEDITFDIVWQSRGRVTERGYQVEIAIPFASLRFPDGDRQSWRVNFWRDQQREVRRRYAWAATNRDDPCFTCQWGTMNGIEGIHPGRGAEVIVSALGTQAGELADQDDPRARFDNHHLDGEAGMNVRYALSSSASAQLALNPDFSQVESDEAQIDVNTTYALFYPERRPFFQEGSDLYDTWIPAIYTRSVNDPDVAGKLTGRFGSTSLLYLVANDEHTLFVLPFEERSEFVGAGPSTSNILRVRRSLRDESYVGALVTDRRLEGGGAGTVLAADGQIRLWQNYRLELQAAASRTEEPDDPALTADVDTLHFDDGKYSAAFDGERYWGRSFYASVERSARIWNLDLDYWEFSPTFRTDNGFTTRNDYREFSGWSGLSFSPNRAWVVEWEPSIGVGRIWKHDGAYKDGWIRPNLWINTRGQTTASLEYLWSKERFGPETFPGIRIASLNVETRFSEVLQCGASFRRGQGIYRDFDDPELADQRNISLWMRVKPWQRLELETTLDHARMESRERDEVLFSGYILRNRLGVNFTREWFLRLVVQYDDFGERLDVEPLVTYRVNPFTVFYLGATDGFRRYDVEDHPSLSDTEWRTASRQVFAKVQYLFRL